MTRRLVALVCLGVFLVPATILAQEFRATVNGRVIDPSSAAVPNATVTIKNVATNEVATATTDPSGNYTIPFLRPGTYDLSAEAPGFKKQTHEGLVLNVGQAATINITLQVGAVTESVTVTAEVPLLETAKADRGLVIDSQRVREFPLNARNPFMLSLLTAGVNFNGNIIYQRPFDNGAIADWNINGGWNRSNEFLLDGAPNNAQAGGNNIALVPSVDTVQEFKIQTNSYDSQYGKTSGGIVNVAIKSGGNDVHGTLYEFARRHYWDANSFQNNARGVDRYGCAPSDSQCRKTNTAGHFLDQYGGTIGGPIWVPKIFNGKDKAFFFFGYEGYREGTPTPLNLSIPAPEFAQGDFSNLRDNQGRLITIYNPFTGRNVNGVWTRDAFANNRIPANMLNPIAVNILKMYPAPNVPSAGSFYSQQNYFVPGGENLDKDDFYNLLIRFDFNIGDRHRVFLRHASNDRTEWRPTNPILDKPGADGQLPLIRVNDAYVLDWVGTMNPTTIVNVRTSWNRYIEGSRGDPNKGHSPVELGFPQDLVRQLSVTDWFGRYELDNYSALGRYFGVNFTNNFAIHPSLSKTFHGHSIKTGVDFRLIVYNQLRPGNAFRIQGTRAFTQREYNRGDALSGSSVASLLLGVPGNAEAAYNVNPSNVFRYYAPYFQDDWKVTPKLTLNLGVRWDINQSAFERHDRMNRSFDSSMVNPADRLINRTAFPTLPTLKGGLLFAGVGDQPRKAGNTDMTAIQPRFGLAYQFTRNMVFRGGIGKYYLNPNNDYLQFTGYDASTPIITSPDSGRTPIQNFLNNPFPNGINIPPGSSQGPLTFLGRGFNFFDPTFKLPYVYQFSAGIQYELPWSSSVEVSYVGNRTYKLESNYDFNEIGPEFRAQCNPMEGGNPAYCDALVPNPFQGLAPFAGTGLGTNATVARSQLARPFPEFTGIGQRGRNDGKVWYNALQTTYQLRGKGGMNVSVAYTLSKMIEQWSWQDQARQKIGRGLYLYDRPHSLKVGSVWELPFGKGRRFFNTSHGFWSRVASGWQHTMIFQYNSGRPWDLPGSVLYLKEAKIKDIDWDAPLIRGIRPCVLKWNSDNTITPQAYSIANGCGTDQSTYNFLIKPRFTPDRFTPTRDGRLRLNQAPQFDMSINKTTRINERMSIQFRAESFNVFNTFMFPQQQFNNDAENTLFGTITKGTVAQGSANFPRHIQFGVKFIF